MTTGADWQTDVGRTWAESHTLTDRSFSGLTTQFLARLATITGDAILDVGCGAGELALALADRRPQATIVGIDISSDLIAVARARGGPRQNTSFVETDAAIWDSQGFAPNLIVSRHGVMFFPDPAGAFGNLANLAAPGAALAFTCFREPRLNPWFGALTALLPAESKAPVDPNAPGPFSFADPDRVGSILAQGGWSGIAFEPIDFSYIAGRGDDAVADAARYFQRIGPAAPLLRELADGSERTAVLARMTGWLEQNHSGDTVSFPAAAWLVTARRASARLER